MSYRWSLALVCAAACGRFEFDDGPADAIRYDDADAAGIDAEVCATSPCQLVLPQCGCPDGTACQRTGATTAERACIAQGTIGADEAFCR